MTCSYMILYDTWNNHDQRYVVSHFWQHHLACIGSSQTPKFGTGKSEYEQIRSLESMHEMSVDISD